MFNYRLISTDGLMTYTFHIQASSSLDAKASLLKLAPGHTILSIVCFGKLASTVLSDPVNPDNVVYVDFKNKRRSQNGLL